MQEAVPLAFTPFYKDVNAVERFGLQSLKSLEGGKGGNYWNLSSSVSARTNYLLSTVGQCITARRTIIPDIQDRRTPSSSGHPFDSPWCDVTRVTNFDGSSSSTSVPTCMLLDRSKLTKGMVMIPRRGETPTKKMKNKWQRPPPPNYVHIYMGSLKRMPIYEYCHRFVCAAINGPPDEDAGLTDVVHMCQRPGDPSKFGDPACVSPLHMVFGSPEDNQLTGVKAQARFQVLVGLSKARRESSTSSSRR